MKKILFALLLCTIAVTVFAQKFDAPVKKFTEDQISQMVRILRENNKNAGLPSPDSVQPGQIVDFTLWDGGHKDHVVKKGETIKTILANMQPDIEKHGGPTSMDTTSTAKVGDVGAGGNSQPQEYSFWERNGDWITIVGSFFLIIAACVLAYFLVRKYQAAQRPLTSDDLRRRSPVREGGVRSRDAIAYMNELGRRFNVQWLGDIQKGYFTSLRKTPIRFANGDKAKKLANVPSYRRFARVDGIEKDIIFFEPCGNLSVIGRFIPDLVEGIDYIWRPIGNDQELNQSIAQERARTTAQPATTAVTSAERVVLAVISQAPQILKETKTGSIVAGADENGNPTISVDFDDSTLNVNFYQKPLNGTTSTKELTADGSPGGV